MTQPTTPNSATREIDSSLLRATHVRKLVLSALSNTSSATFCGPARYWNQVAGLYSTPRPPSRILCSKVYGITIKKDDRVQILRLESTGCVFSPHWNIVPKVGLSLPAKESADNRPCRQNALVWATEFYLSPGLGRK